MLAPESLDSNRIGVTNRLPTGRTCTLSRRTPFVVLMLTSLAIAASLVAPAPQSCAQDLPLPSVGLVRQLGRDVEIDGNLALATDTSFPRLLYIWDRDEMGDWGSPSTLDAGGTISNLNLDGDVLLLRIVVGGQIQPRVWRRQPDGSWLQDPALIPPVAGGTFDTPFALRGDRLAVRGGGPRIWIYEFHASTGTWDFAQALTDSLSSNGTFGFGLQLGDDRLVTQSGVSGATSATIFDLDPAGQWTQTQIIDDGLSYTPLDLDGDRLLLRHGVNAETWRLNPAGTWKLEQELPPPPGSTTIQGELDGRHLAISVRPGLNPFAEGRRIRSYARGAGSFVWLQQGELAPPGGMQSLGADFGTSFALDRGTLIAGEPNFDITPGLFDDNQGRVAAMELDCLGSPPVVHWIPGSISAPGPDFPTDYTTAVVSTDSALTLGPPHGLRNPELSLRADYSLNITGQPCTFSYGSEVCSYVAYSVRDGVGGTPSDNYPVDPFAGSPQLFNSVIGPDIDPSSTQTLVQWPYLFEQTILDDFSLEPTGQPMDLQIAAASYNCFDAGGIWFQQGPDTVAGSCGYSTLPTSIQSLDLDLTVSGLLAFDLAELNAQNQSTVCDPRPNSTGAGARLTAEGSPVVADGELYLAIDNVPPGEPGLLFLASQPATPPYADLGQGQLCIGSPLLRLLSTFSVANSFGHVATQLDFSALPAGAVIQPGSTWYLQYVFRDHNFGATTNTSSAIAVTFE